MDIQELISKYSRMKEGYSSRSASSETSNNSGFGKGSDSDNRGTGPTDFSSGLKFPKLDSELGVKEKGKVQKTLAKKKANEIVPKVKMQKVKELHNTSMMLGTEDPEVMSTRANTGLFNSSNAFYENDNSVNEDDDETTSKIKTFIKKHKKNTKLDHEIQSRISQAYQKMENLEKGFKSMDSTILAAKERVHKSKVEVKSPKLLSETFSSTSSLLKNWQAKKELVKSQSPNSEEDFVNDTNVEDGTFEKKLENVFALPTSRASTPLTPQIPGVKDKRFLAKLQRRGTKLHKEISGIKTRLEIENNKSKKNEQKINKTKTLPKPKDNFTLIESGRVPKQTGRLLEHDPDKGATKEFTDFLQSHGGMRGGWDKVEHQNFLKNYIKFKSNPTKLIEIVSKSCPDRTVQEIATHLEWYDKYLELNNSSKESIREWDLKKRKERQTMFQMAKEDQKAKLESERSHQEMLKFRREQEKVRQKDNLEAWKKSMENKLQASSYDKIGTVTEKLNEIDTALTGSLNGSSNITEPDTSLLSTKLREDIKVTKEKLIKALPKTHQAHKVLAKIGTSGPTLSRRRQSKQVDTEMLSRPSGWKDYMKPTSASLSSGIFSDYSEEVKPREIFTFQQRLGHGDTLSKSNVSVRPNISKVVTGSGDASLFASQEPHIPAQKLITKGLAGPVRRGTNPKLVKMFQARDAELVEARKTAIQHKKEQQKNKANLSVDQVRERLTKLDVPSQIQQLTKGLKIRHSIKELEAVEAETRAVKRKDSSEYHKLSRVATPQLFKTESSIRTVAKLGVPAWRNG